MKIRHLFPYAIAAALPCASAGAAPVQELVVATFNVSMESENYQPKSPGPLVLAEQLATKSNSQIQNIAAILQQVRPDIVLLNEFDYIADPERGVLAFIRNYLQQSQRGLSPIDYPYFYYNTVNTGQASGFDLNRDGVVSPAGDDAWGFGLYPGHYGMVLLSKYPIDKPNVRTFQHFRWRDMPGYLMPKTASGEDWYPAEVFANMPLSSKSHWDVPIRIGTETLHVLASHPTPPVFDGPENRNGLRNHDEVRFWLDYLNPSQHYMVDDQGRRGPLATGQRFVIVGDLNSSPDEGDAKREAIVALTNHPAIWQQPIPASSGGKLHSPTNTNGQFHTAVWRMRADYVLPSTQGFLLQQSGVFWPAPAEPLADVVSSRGASSDHRLVWARLTVTPLSVPAPSPVASTPVMPSAELPAPKNEPDRSLHQPTR